MSDRETRFLLDLKDKVDRAKAEDAKLNGMFEQSTKQMKDAYKVNSLKEAQALLEEKREELKKVDEDIEEQTQILEKRYL